MCTFGLLGATGQIGGEVLKNLLKSSAESGTRKSINVLVRSRAKLERQLQTNDYKSFDRSLINVFEIADVNSDIDTLAKCMRGTRSVFLCVAANANKPDISVAQDQAKAVVAALETLRAEDSASPLPRLVILSSSEAERTPHFSKTIPWPAKDILYAANYYIYEDLIAAEEYIRQECHSWISYTYIKPGGLSWDVARGHEISFDTQQTFLSFADLAGGMVEVAEEDEEKYVGKGVSVISPGGKAKFPLYVPPLLMKGLLIYCLPSLGSWLN